MSTFSAFNAMQNEKADAESNNNSPHFSKLANPDNIIIEPEYSGPDLTLPLDIGQITKFIEAFKEKKVTL